MSNDTTTRPGMTRTKAAPDDMGSLQALQRSWGWLLALGVVLILAGVMALALPVVATIAVQTVIGVALLAIGVFQLFHVFTCGGWRGRLFHLLSAAICLAGGALVLLNPLTGLVAITLVVIAVLFADGLSRIAVGAAMRPQEGWGWVLGGGILTAVLALALFMLFPAVSLTLLGVLAGVSFLFEGWAFIMVAIAARRAQLRMEEHPV